MQQHADLFTHLLSSDPQWRGRTFKLLQYSARCAAVAQEFHRARGSSVSGALELLLGPPARLSDLAKSLSTVRRGMALFDTCVYVRDVAAQLRTLEKAHPDAASMAMAVVASPRIQSAILNSFAGLADDLSTAGSFGLINGKLLPSWFEPLHSKLWAAQCGFSLYFSVAALASVRAARTASRTPSTAAADLDHQLTMAMLNVIKAACDLGQSLPHALQKSHLLPVWLDVSLGLSSAALAVYRVWTEATARMASSADALTLSSAPPVPAAVSGAPARPAEPNPFVRPEEAVPAAAAAPAAALALPNGALLFQDRDALSGLDVAPSPIARREEAGVTYSSPAAVRAASLGATGGGAYSTAAAAAGVSLGGPPPQPQQQRPQQQQQPVFDVALAALAARGGLHEQQPQQHQPSNRGHSKSSKHRG